MNNETNSSLFRFKSRVASLFMSAALLATTFTGLGGTLVSAASDEASAPVYAAAAPAASSNLPDSIYDGNILHCFNWTLGTIKENLPQIAEAGFTSIQTSPLQPHDAQGPWYWIYQPLGFSIGNELGDENDLKSLCEAAHGYGIKVIVDVVANHLAGSKSGEWKGYIQSDLNNSQYFHNQGAASNWDDRNEIIYKNIGMPDLNTENSYVIDVVKGYVNKLKSCGVDGIRWDAAKHIGLPSEGSNFWSTMSGLGMYMYGEILDGPAGSERDNQGNIIQSRYDYNSSLAAEYGKYIGVTDGNYSGEITGSIRDGRVSESDGKWIKRGVAAEHVVYWAESHDTYSNDDGGWTKNLSESVMDRAYAVLGARAKSQSLYLSRPNAKASDSITIGSKGNDHYQSAQVAEVNKFHNANVGTNEYFTTSNNCYVVCRGKGAVVVNAGGGGKQVTVPNGGGLVPAGTYTDKVGGGTWTVDANNMTGTIGDTGIAVFYNGESVSGSVSVSPSKDSFETTLTVTLNAKDATDLTYTTSEGDSGSYTNGKTITVGAKTAVGGTVTVTVSGKNSKGETVTAKGTYTKIDPNAKVTVNVDNSVGKWTKVYAYVYKAPGGTGNEVKAWPGVEMTEGSKYLTLDVTGWEDALVIFNDGTGSATNRYPADMKPGLSIGGSSKLFTMPDKWVDLPQDDDKKISVSLSASPATVKVGDKVTLTATPSNATGTVTYSFKAGSTALTASGATATWTADAAGTKTFTVTATDSKGSATATASVTVEGGNDNTPTVTANKASGTSFTDETLDVTLTLKNADKGYYQIDGGSKKLINGSTTIKVGEGKIGDTTVTVKAVAIGSDKTEKTYTFTYDKKYVAKSTSSSAGTLSSYYKTNPNGQTGGSGVTITSAADFKENMIIAQGVANDDPRMFRGSHEGPVYDSYALYAAWDSTNLYLGWQFVNVTDVSDPLQGYPISDNGKPYILSIPQMILIDTGKGTKGDTSTQSLDTGKFVWNIAVGSKGMFDTMICFSSQPGVGEPSLFKATSSGLFSYTDGAVPFKEGGISFKYEDGFFGSKIYGIKASGYETSELLSDSSNWVDFLTEGHDKTKDTFYVMTIPLATLGIDKAYLESTGIGVMHVSTFGASGLQSCPMDYDAFLDNAKTPYSADDSTSGEKEDIDVVTVSLARVGAGGDNPPPPPPPTSLTVNFGTDKAAPQLPTTKLTLKAVAAGGTSPYKYAFYVDGTQVQAASSTATYSWTPGSEKSYTIKCVVTDSAGKSETVSKTFTAALDDDLDDPTPKVLTNKSSVSATTVKVGSSVTLNGSAAGGTTPYQFSYAYKLSSASSYTSIKAYSSATSAQFTPSAAGTYTVKISVKDAADTVKDQTFTVTASDNPTTLTNKSTISATTVKLGGTITVNCAASGGTTPYKYAVYYKKSSSTSYTTAQSYSTTKTVGIKPGAATVYNVRVKVKDAKDTVKTLDFDFAVTNPDADELKNTSKLSAASIEKGSSVTITGSATGGKTSYQYSAYYKKGSDSFTKIRDYSKTATMTFKPTSTGTYTIRVKVKDAAGKVVNKDLTLKVTAALSNTSKLSATTVAKGKSITITGAATGGTSPYKYAAYYKKASSTEYTKIRDYSTTATMTFKPAAAVKYNVRVKVKDAKGTVKNKDFTVTVTNAELSNTSKVSATSITLGKSVTITGAATGGTTPYKYAAYYKKASSTEYTKIRDYSTTATMTFKPAAAVKYNVRVKVKDSKNTVKNKDFTITVTNAELANTSKVSATSVTLGKSVTITGAATGGTTPYKYAAWYKKASASDYTKLRDYSTTATMTFKPASAVKYSVRVKVKDAKNVVRVKDFTITVTNAGLSNTSKISATSVKLGTTITLTGAATGGTTPYQYSAYYKKTSSTEYTKICGYSTTTKMTFKPGAAATYDVKVKVKDKTGKIVSKDFKLTVTK